MQSSGLWNNGYTVDNNFSRKVKKKILQKKKQVKQ